MAACARPGYREPTSEQQTAGSMWALARDHSVTPGVTSLTAPAPTSGNRWFARPWFPIGVPHCAEHRQAGFCPCTLRRSSDPPEPTFGHPRYLFGGVPPQPNSPPDAVPGLPGKRSKPPGAVSHGRLHGPRKGRFDASRLRFARRPRPQRQAAVKLHGVFTSRRALAVCSRPKGFAGFRAGTAGASLRPSCKPPIKRRGITLP